MPPIPSYAKKSLGPNGGDAAIPTIRLSYDRHTGKHGVRTKTKPFILGPIPLDWITRANSLRGKAGATGLALFFLKGVKQANTFKVTAEAEQIAACSRQAFSRGLVALQDAGLITLQQRSGARPIVTILACK